MADQAAPGGHQESASGRAAEPTRALQPALQWSLVIPVKVLALAKSRLAVLADADRRALVLAMAADTVAAAVACPQVETVTVVTDDPEVAAEVSALGAEVAEDLPRAGLNAALVAGSEHAAASRPGLGRAALTADLPALSPGALATALTSAATVAEAFVADAAGSGTTLYATRPGTAFRPRFGPGSRELHRQAGAVELDLAGIAGLRRDVDTLEDLRAAAVIGLGRRSAALAATMRNRDVRSGG